MQNVRAEEYKKEGAVHPEGTRIDNIIIKNVQYILHIWYHLHYVIVSTHVVLCVMYS